VTSEETAKIANLGGFAVGVMENLKEAALVAQKVGQLELYKQIVQAEDEVRDLTREKRRLEDTVEDLERKLKLRAAMNFKAPFYYQHADSTPFCSACYEGKEERAVHLTNNVLNYSGKWFCPVCRNTFSEDSENNGPAFGIAPMSRG
jgi:hypothetical protein